MSRLPETLIRRTVRLSAFDAPGSSSRLRRPRRLPTVILTTRFGRYLDALRWIWAGR